MKIYVVIVELKHGTARVDSVWSTMKAASSRERQLINSVGQFGENVYTVSRNLNETEDE